jgi:hypothetical protein
MLMITQAKCFTAYNTDGNLRTVEIRVKHIDGGSNIFMFGTGYSGQYPDIPTVCETMQQGNRTNIVVIRPEIRIKNYPYGIGLQLKIRLRLRVSPG